MAKIIPKYTSAASQYDSSFKISPTTMTATPTNASIARIKFRLLTEIYFYFHVFNRIV